MGVHTFGQNHSYNGETDMKMYNMRFIVCPNFHIFGVALCIMSLADAYNIHLLICTYMLYKLW